MKKIFSLILAASVLLASSVALAGKLGVFTASEQGFDTHTFYYDDGQEVVLIDTQFVPALTAAMLEQIHRETRSPVTRVIVTHPNPDKFNGLAYLHKLGVHSLSSEGVATAMPSVNDYKQHFWIQTMKSFTAITYPKFENVQETFKGRQTLRLASGETLTLIELAHAGVASKQVVVRIDQTGDLIVGDLVHHRAHAWLEGALINGRPQPVLSEWIAALDELPALANGHPEAKIYGGRGEFVSVIKAVQEQQRYLTQSEKIVDAYMHSLSTAERQQLRDETMARPHYQRLQQRFTEAFPDYRLPYMIGYSVYGLVQSRLPH